MQKKKKFETRINQSAASHIKRSLEVYALIINCRYSPRPLIQFKT